MIATYNIQLYRGDSEHHHQLSQLSSFIFTRNAWEPYLEPQVTSTKMSEDYTKSYSLNSIQAMPPYS